LQKERTLISDKGLLLINEQNKLYNMSEIKYFTEEGLENLKKEVNHMISVERPAISRQIAEARDKGDLSENAEYDAAKEAQGLLELKISKMQEVVRNARVIDESKMDTSKVYILSTVKIKNLKNNMEMTYSLVPENEADLKKGKISVSSPIAKGLLGKKVGDHVDIQVPAGTIPFEVIEISR
jgi:transcription elongation factor GreA